MTATDTPPTVGQLLGNGPPSNGDGPALTPFEGRDVSATTITIPNAGGGLRKALEVDPRELHQGERVTLVLDCEVDKIRFDPVKDDDTLERLHVLKAVRATFIDTDAVRDALDAQQRRIDEAEGVQQLPFGEGEEADVEGDAGSDDLAAEAGA